ncbi:hypothetical protein Tco_0407501 [Tanacetum coccineum]
MRIEQYLQCIDYTLWEIIENGNAPIITKTINGKETVIPPAGVEKKAQRRAELKARSTLLSTKYKQLDNEDLQQIHLDDLEEMDFRRSEQGALLKDCASGGNTSNAYMSQCEGLVIDDYEMTNAERVGPTTIAFMA